MEKHMRRNVSLRLLTAAMLIGLWGYAGAADVSDDDYKTLIDQDIKLIGKAVEAYEKAKDQKVTGQRASSGVKSDALYIAAYANARITGKNAAEDGKMAAVRDTAIKLAKAADMKDFKAIAEAAKELENPKAAASATKIDVAKAFGELSVDDVMHHFKKPTAYGGEWEDLIKDNAANKKGRAVTPAVAAAIAQRTLIMGEYSKTIMKAENAKEKKEWTEYNEKLIKAAEDLHKAAKGKKEADMTKAFKALNESCTTCHSAFK
jgi:hypothetical protein